MQEFRPQHPEQLRPRAPRPTDGGFPGDGSHEDTGGTVHITWGALVDDLEVADMTVGEVQNLLQDAYNIAPDVQINVNGVEVTANTRLSAGDSLEFVRAAGEKGGC
jgi:hypothetical protein